MKYYKDPNTSEVFAYDEDGSQDKYIPNHYVRISEEDINREIAARTERVWRNSELNRADIELYKVQDSDSKAVGSVSPWREYRKALRQWPENQHFPDSSKRPIAPDAQ